MLLFASANREIVLTSAKGCCGFEHLPPPHNKPYSSTLVYLVEQEARLIRNIYHAPELHKNTCFRSLHHED